MRWCLSWWVVLAIPAWVTVAHAQSEAAVVEEAAADGSVAADAGVAEAQSLFRRGLALGAEDRWADALEYFRRSYARVARPSTLFNIGVALGRLGRFVEAIATFDELFAGSEAPPEAARVEAERLRAEAVASLGELLLELSPDGATLYVDGVIREGMGSPRPLALDPGRHVVRATAEGHAEGSLDVSIVAAEHASGRLVLDLLPTTSIGGGDDTTIVASGSLLDEPAFWIVGGVLVVAIGVGVGVGVAVGTAGPPEYGGTTGVILRTP